jgi:hypothetical protein
MMLNRKLSNYIYYGVVASVIVVIFIIRILSVGAINNRIDELKKENVILSAQIETLNDEVQTYYNYQSDYIYNLYKEVPSVYSEQTLEFKITSKLERLGITEHPDFRRTFPTPSKDVNISNVILKDFKNDYDFVEIQVSFVTEDPDLVTDFIDLMYDDEQLFILNRVAYSVPQEEGDYITVTLSYYAVYVKDLEE